MSATVPLPKPPGAHSAREAGLYYASDADPGITRVKIGRAFAYRGVDGRPVRDRATLERIRALVIPPAWQKVWIAPKANAHLQATGRDARGRKQYRYHPRWTAVRDETKYTRMLAFARVLPAIRRRVAADLRRTPLSRERVLATVVALLERTLIRVGNDEYARTNGSFGLDDAARSPRRRPRPPRPLPFPRQERRDPEDRSRRTRCWRAASSAARICRARRSSSTSTRPARGGRSRPPTSTTTSATWPGEEFTAKDFRTWSGTVLAACALCADIELAIGDGAQALRRRRPSARSPRGSATPRRCAASATCTRR